MVLLQMVEDLGVLDCELNKKCCCEREDSWVVMGKRAINRGMSSDEAFESPAFPLGDCEPSARNNDQRFSWCQDVVLAWQNTAETPMVGRTSNSVKGVANGSMWCSLVAFSATELNRFAKKDRVDYSASWHFCLRPGHNYAFECDLYHHYCQHFIDRCRISIPPL